MNARIKSQRIHHRVKNVATTGYCRFWHSDITISPFVYFCSEEGINKDEILEEIAYDPEIREFLTERGIERADPESVDYSAVKYGVSFVLLMWVCKVARAFLLFRSS